MQNSKKSIFFIKIFAYINNFTYFCALFKNTRIMRMRDRRHVSRVDVVNKSYVVDATMNREEHRALRTSVWVLAVLMPAIGIVRISGLRGI